MYREPLRQSGSMCPLPAVKRVRLLKKRCNMTHSTVWTTYYLHFHSSDLVGVCKYKHRRERCILETCSQASSTTHEHTHEHTHTRCFFNLLQIRGTGLSIVRVFLCLLCHDITLRNQCSANTNSCSPAHTHAHTVRQTSCSQSLC